MHFDSGCILIHDAFKICITMKIFGMHGFSSLGLLQLCLAIVLKKDKEVGFLPQTPIF